MSAVCRLLHATYDNGDEFRIEFFDVLDSDQLAGRYAGSRPEGWRLSYP